MDERLRFVARLLDGEKMAPLCREFDISRKTGYKLFERYKDCGLSGLTDRSRRRAAARHVFHEPVRRISCGPRARKRGGRSRPFPESEDQ